MTENVIKSAQANWRLDLENSYLFATRENHIYKLTDTNSKQYALRVHRLNYSSLDELNSELAWMKMLSENDISVPTPLLSKNEQLVEVIDGYYVDLLTWLNGEPMGKTGSPLSLPNRLSTFHNLGKTLAKLHSLSDTWDAPEGFKKREWNSSGLLGERPHWGRFWENPSLTEGQALLLSSARYRAIVFLNEHKDTLDFNLIHADPVRENILIEHDKLHLIDFDDSGTGFRLYDIATALIKNEGETDYEQLKHHLLEGYRSIKPLDTEHLEFFSALRSFTYVGWIITRLSEEGGEERNTRFVKDALSKAEWLLENY